MRVLLDTHIALWAILGSEKLPSRARVIIEDPENEIFVSAVSALEIALKRAGGRVGPGVPQTTGSAAVLEFERAGYVLLPITPQEAGAVEALPMHHADPFDRLLVAQALIGPYRLLTHDRKIARYSDLVIQV